LSTFKPESFAGAAAAEKNDPVPAYMATKIDHSYCDMFNSSPNQTAWQDKNVVAYIGGWAIKKLAQLLCSECRGCLSGSLSPDNPSHMLSSAKH